MTIIDKANKTLRTKDGIKLEFNVSAISSITTHWLSLSSVLQ